MLQRSRRRWAASAGGVLILLATSGVLGACSSSGSAKSASAAGTTNATGSPNGSTGATNTQPSGSSSSSTHTVTVDLVITGDRPAKIKGSKGTCTVPSNRTLAAGYDFSGADYPALGPQGNFNVTGPQKATSSGQLGLAPSIKVLIKDGGFLDTDGSGIKVSPDQTEIQLDADISGSTAGTIDNPGAPLHGHVTGTMSCR